MLWIIFLKVGCSSHRSSWFPSQVGVKARAPVCGANNVPMKSRLKSLPLSRRILLWQLLWKCQYLYVKYKQCSNSRRTAHNHYPVVFSQPVYAGYKWYYRNIIILFNQSTCSSGPTPTPPPPNRSMCLTAFSVMYWYHFAPYLTHGANCNDGRRSTWVRAMSNCLSLYLDSWRDRKCPK